MGHSAIGTTVSNSVPVSMTDGPAAALVGYGVAAVVVLSIPPHSPSDEEPGQSADGYEGRQRPARTLPASTGRDSNPRAATLTFPHSCHPTTVRLPACADHRLPTHTPACHLATPPPISSIPATAVLTMTNLGETHVMTMALGQG